MIASFPGRWKLIDFFYYKSVLKATSGWESMTDRLDMFTIGDQWSDTDLRWIEAGNPSQVHAQRVRMSGKISFVILNHDLIK